MIKREINYVSSNGASQIHGTVFGVDNDVEVIALIQICHGMKEYIGRYEDFAAYMAKRGIIVFGNDHIGHGESVSDESELGAFCKEASENYLVDDAKKFSDIMVAQHPNSPLFLLGHSMGSFISRLYINKYPRMLKGYVMMGSADKQLAKVGKLIANLIISLNKDNWKTKSKLLNNVAFANYNKRIRNLVSENAWISSDDEVVKKYDLDPLCNYDFKMSGYRDLMSMIAQVSSKSWAEKVDKTLPILILVGKEDPVGNYSKEVEKIYKKLEKYGVEDLQIKLYDGARHEILNEYIKYEVYQDIQNWIEERI